MHDPTTPTFLRRLRPESGATAVEYALMVAMISVVIAMSAGAVGTALSGTFSQVAAAFGSGSGAEDDGVPLPGDGGGVGTAGKQNGKSGDTNGHGKGSGGGKDH